MLVCFWCSPAATRKFNYATEGWGLTCPFIRGVVVATRAVVIRRIGQVLHHQSERSMLTDYSRTTQGSPLVRSWMEPRFAGDWFAEARCIKALNFNPEWWSSVPPPSPHLLPQARPVREILARRYTKTTSFLGDKTRPERDCVPRDERLRLVCRRLKDEHEITIKARQNTAWIWPRLKLNCILSHSCHYTLWNVELVLRQHEHTSRAGSGIMTRRGINKTIFPWIGVYVFYIHVDKKSCCPTNSNHCVRRVTRQVGTGWTFAAILILLLRYLWYM